MNNQNKKTLSLKKLTIAAIFAALITVLTTISVRIPGSGGYIHLGDSMIYACAWAVGGPIAAFASAIGSVFADLILAPQYAPITFVIKFLMALVCYLIMKALSYKPFGNVIAMLTASVIMVVGYTLYEYIIGGIGKVVTALVFNSIQAVGGVVTGAVLIFVLDKISAFSPYINWKANKENERN